MCVQDSSLAEQERVTHAIDHFGGRSPISALLPLEHAAACEALLLLVTATSKRAPPADAVLLVQLLKQQCAHGAGSATPRPHVHALAAFAALVLPRWPEPDAGPAADDAPLSAILKSSEVAQAVAALPAERSGLAAAAQLTFAAATIAWADGVETREAAAAAQLLGKALDAAALHALVRSGPLRTATCMVDCLEMHFACRRQMNAQQPIRSKQGFASLQLPAGLLCNF